MPRTRGRPGLLLDAGFDDRTAEHGLNLVIVYTLGFVALEVPRLADAPTSFDEQAIARLYDALPTDDFPHTTAVRPQPHAIVSKDQFEFGLTCLLDGIAARHRR